MSLYRLDVAALYERLDKQRLGQGISWRDLGRQLDIPSSTFTRMTRGGGPSADALVTLLVWLDMDNDIVYVVERSEP